MEPWATGPEILSASFRGELNQRIVDPQSLSAHYAISDSSGDDCPGIHLGAGKEKHAVANMALSLATPKSGGLVAQDG